MTLEIIKDGETISLLDGTVADCVHATLLQCQLTFSDLIDVIQRRVDALSDNVPLTMYNDYVDGANVEAEKVIQDNYRIATIIAILIDECERYTTRLKIAASGSILNGEYKELVNSALAYSGKQTAIIAQLLQCMTSYTMSVTDPKTTLYSTRGDLVEEGRLHNFQGGLIRDIYAFINELRYPPIPNDDHAAMTMIEERYERMAQHLKNMAQRLETIVNKYTSSEDRVNE